MKILKYFSLLIVVVLLAFGCADKKDEASQLEQEMMAQDSVADTTQVQDTMVDPMDTPEEEYAPEEPKTTMPAQPPGEGYTVQVASCTDEAYAEYLVDKYTSRGYEPYVKTITFEGVTHYRVRIGVYENFSEAVALQAELKDKYSLETWVDHTQPDF